MAGVIVDSTILHKFIEVYLPDLVNYLTQIGCELNLDTIIFKWFVSLFVQALPMEFSLIIWDMLFLEGNIVIFKAALGLFKILKKELMTKTSMGNIKVYIIYKIHLNT